jgi:hypothetical protein
MPRRVLTVQDLLGMSASALQPGSPVNCSPASVRPALRIICVPLVRCLRHDLFALFWRFARHAPSNFPQSGPRQIVDAPAQDPPSVLL